MNNRPLWLALLVLPPLIWAGNALVGRALVGAVTPFELAFWRWLIALVLLVPFTLRDVIAHRRVLLRHWPVVVTMGLCSVGGYNTFLYMAVQTTTAINATLVGASMPLMILILSAVWLGEKVRVAQMVGIAISVVGVLAVVTHGEIGRLLQLTFTPGDGLMLLSTLCWAVYSVMLRRYPLNVPGTTLLTVLIVVGLAAITPFYVWQRLHAPVLQVEPAVIGAILYTAILASLVAYYLWNRGVIAVGAATAGLYTYLIPLFTAVLAVLLLGESFRSYHAVGTVLIFAGVALATRRAPAKS